MTSMGSTDTASTGSMQVNATGAWCLPTKEEPRTINWIDPCCHWDDTEEEAWARKLTNNSDVNCQQDRHGKEEEESLTGSTWTARRRRPRL